MKSSKTNVASQVVPKALRTIRGFLEAGLHFGDKGLKFGIPPETLNLGYCPPPSNSLY